METFSEQNQSNADSGVKKFNSPEEEVSFLREQIRQKEKEIRGGRFSEAVLEQQEKSESAKFEQLDALEPPGPFHKTGARLERNTPRETIRQYARAEPEAVLAENRPIKDEDAEEIVLELTPRDSDEQIGELLGMLEEKGIKNTLTIIQKMKNPALEDDFHRVLVQYLKQGYAIKNLKEKSPLFRRLKMTLYEISLPNQKGDKEKTLKELISSMEQFYAGMLALSGSDKSGDNYFSFEIALSSESDEVVIYSAIPDSKKNLFEKQILSVFPAAKIEENKDDYNIFKKDFVASGARLLLYKKPAYSIRTYDNFDYDPLNIILNSFSKLSKEEGAAIQIVFNSRSNSYNEKYKIALAKIRKGAPAGEALSALETTLGEIAKTLKDAWANNATKSAGGPVNEAVVENIQAKISSPIIQTNIRLIGSARTQGRAAEILSEMEASFNQFENPNGNKIIFKKLKQDALKKFLRQFSFREFEKKQIIPLNIKEITTLFHLPNTGIQAARQLKQVRAKSAPAPLELSQTGVLLGVNSHHNVETRVFISPEDRLRHFYVIGQTGTGKTALLKNMIAQDIKNGDGVCMIDPHGSDLQDVLEIIPPDRYEDLIYFDPAQTAYPLGLNMLEYDAAYPEQKTFVVNEMLSIFNKLFDMKTAGGPMFEQYFRNAVLLAIDNPRDKSTLLDVSKVLSNKEFREQKLRQCQNPTVVQFWREVAEKSGGEASLENIVPYITSKFDVFLSNDLMRPIIAQSESAFNFREIMDDRKILLVNLSKGRLGDINSHLLGLIIVGKILLAALSRAGTALSQSPPFYLYIDEFQNVTTDSISIILSEARKYKLSLNIAHQFIAQLDDGIKNAVFGNVGSLAVFRAGADDADYLAKQFEPIFDAQDIINLDNYNAYLKLLAGGQPQTPFNIRTIVPPAGSPNNAEKLKELSYLKYGKEKSLIEKEIMAKYR